MKPARILDVVLRSVPLAALWLGVALSLAPVAEASVGFLVPDVADVVTDAGYCPTCGATERVTRSNRRQILASARRNARAAAAAPAAEAAPTATTSFDEKIGLLAYNEAVRGRRSAGFRGRGWRTGNHSKSMCASVVKDVLLKMNVCKSRPGGDAIDLAGRRGTLARSCDVSPLATKNPRSAPKNSIIVYSGYAGNRPHTYGHVEMKLQVTPALKRRMASDRYVNKVPVGGFIYCSDYCRAVPTQSRKGTNPVAAIFEMK